MNKPEATRQASFTYDGLGRRISKTIGGSTTRYLCDGANVVQELDATNAPTLDLITGFGPDEVYWRSGGTNATTDSLLTDGLGSTVATTTPAATPAIRDSFTYTPHGTPDSSAFPYLFTGRDHDPATGLQFNRVRYYQPGTGRFISEDPIGVLGGSANLYVYGANSPVALRDPYGLDPTGFGQVLDYLLSLIRSGATVALVFAGLGLFPFYGTTIAAIYLANWTSGIGFTLAFILWLRGEGPGLDVGVSVATFAASGLALALFPGAPALYVALGVSIGQYFYDAISGGIELEGAR